MIETAVTKCVKQRLGSTEMYAACEFCKRSLICVVTCLYLFAGIYVNSSASKMAADKSS